MRMIHLLLTYRSKQSDAHKALSETISAQVSNFGPQQLEMKSVLSDQRDTAKRICLNTQRIIKQQASLGRSMSTQHTEVRDHLHFQARNQERAFPSQKSAATQIGINVQNANAQVEAILALQRSLAEFVFFICLV